MRLKNRVKRKDGLLNKIIFSFFCKVRKQKRKVGLDVYFAAALASFFRIWSLAIVYAIE